MKFGTVTLKSMRSCSKVYISLIIGFIFVSVNNFCCTNLTCQYYREVGGCIWLWPSRTWVITCLLLCCSSFNTSINLQVEGWCTTISFEICFASLPLWCLSFNHPSVLICKHCRFLVDILELLVFCLCYAFLRHTLSQHNPLGHLIFFCSLHSVLKSFIYIFQRYKWKSQQHGCSYVCYFLLSYTHVLDPKKDIFHHSSCETSIFMHLVVVKSYSYLQSWNLSCTMKGLMTFLSCADANIHICKCLLVFLLGYKSVAYYNPILHCTQ